MKILFVSQYYPPESNAPANRVSRLAENWVKAGHEVTVLTTFPNHPEGRVYPGFRANHVSEEIEGRVRVLRVPIYVAANRGVIRRSVAYFSFFLSVLLFGWSRIGRPDVVIATSPQLLAGVAGALLSARLQRPFVLEVRDLWPDSIAAVGALPEHHWLMRLLHVVERWLYRQADRVVVVTRSFEKILAKRGVDPDVISFFPNGVDSDIFNPEPLPHDPIGPNDPWPGRFVVCFAGTVGMAHGLGTVLETARNFRDESSFLFVVAGEGAERTQLERRAQEEGLDNVVFLGRLPRERIPGLLRRADLSLVILRDSPLFHTVLPSKLFESMGCATPVLLGVDGEARHLISEAGAGLFFQPSSAKDLGAAIKELAGDSEQRRAMGKAGRVFAESNFDRADIASNYLVMLKGAVWNHIGSLGTDIPLQRDSCI